MINRSDLGSVFKEVIQGFTNEETKETNSVSYDKKLLRKNSFHCKQDDAVAVAIISYIGRLMIKTNYSAYSQR
jgi:hypothetical protein